METQIRVFLLAENRLLREALARILNKRADILLVGAMPYSADAMQQIDAVRSQTVLLDAATVMRNELVIVHDLLRSMPHLKVVMIGMEDDEEMFLAAVRAGALGYVHKEASAMDVVGAIRSVAQGEAVCPPQLAKYLFRQVARQAEYVPSIRLRDELGLTRRQQQLVPLIARGLTNKEIASLLHLSEQTIKNHIHRMMQKVGVDDRLEIVELCAFGPQVHS